VVITTYNLQRRPLDTLQLPRLYRSLNWERLAQHSEPRHMNLRSSRALQALGSFTQQVVPLQVPLVPRWVLAHLSLAQREVRGRLDHQEWCLYWHRMVLEL
jgi:hypothetical protein